MWCDNREKYFDASEEIKSERESRVHSVYVCIVKTTIGEKRKEKREERAVWRKIAFKWK